MPLSLEEKCNEDQQDAGMGGKSGAVPQPDDWSSFQSVHVYAQGGPAKMEELPGQEITPKALTEAVAQLRKFGLYPTPDGVNKVWTPS